MPLEVKVDRAAVRAYVARTQARFHAAPVEAKLVGLSGSAAEYRGRQARPVSSQPPRGGERDRLGAPARLPPPDAPPAANDPAHRDGRELRARDRDPAQRQTGSRSTTARGSSASSPSPPGRPRTQRRPAGGRSWTCNETRGGGPPTRRGRRARSRPAGPGNPLGTRWMGLSAPAVGIHGTPDAASIGYSASHGCIRMQIPDAEWPSAVSAPAPGHGSQARPLGTCPGTVPGHDASGQGRDGRAVDPSPRSWLNGPSAARRIEEERG